MWKGLEAFDFHLMEFHLFSMLIEDQIEPGLGLEVYICMYVTILYITLYIKYIYI